MEAEDPLAKKRLEGVHVMRVVREVFLLPLIGIFFLCPLALGYSVEFSKNFTIDEIGPGIVKVVVSNPWRGAEGGFCYILRDKGAKGVVLEKGCEVVDVPIRSMVVLSSTYYALIDALGATDLLIGASRPQRANTPNVRKGYLAGKIKDVGDGVDVGVETIYALKPDVIFTYATGGVRDAHPKLKEAGLRVVVCAEYMEEHPLGRAEWIKFFALFFDRYDRAQSLFDEVVKSYNRLTQLVDTASKGPRPTVITNTPFAGRWFVPGGKSFIAKILEDAGADFLFKGTNTSGSIPMDIELVYEKGLNADYWVNTGTWTSLEDIERSDPRLMRLKAVREKRVYNNNRRVNNEGGNDYWESGVLRPDRILEDLVSIFHPHILKGHTLFYYKRLE